MRKFSTSHLFLLVVIVALGTALLISNQRRTIEIVDQSDAIFWDVPESLFNSSKWVDKTIDPPMLMRDIYMLATSELKRLNNSNEHLALKSRCARVDDWSLTSISMLVLDDNRNVWAYLVKVNRSWHEHLTEHGGVGNFDEKAFWVSMNGETIEARSQIQ
jgi:hypothetical protein